MTYNRPLFGPDWTMTECGPMLPGWNVVSGKPVRELLAYVHAWRRARRTPGAWAGIRVGNDEVTP